MSHTNSCLRYFIFAATLGLASCSSEDFDHPSLLIIAVDDLPSSRLTCEEGEGLGALQTLCDESVRFTHAYATSTMSVPSLATLLTARLPIDNGVVNNGSNFLSARTETLAELARRRAFRTSFFSGGPPVFRKSGLSQGFETFDDYVVPGLEQIFRSPKKMNDLFLSWLDRDVSGDPFFSVLYYPHLQFSEIGWRDRDEEGILDRSYEGRLKYFDAGFAKLIQELKKRKRWNSTIVVLVGLNGRHFETTYRDSRYTDLSSDNSQVALLIKPIRKSRDTGLQWKLDRNVSLVDVSATLFDLLGIKVQTNKLALSQPISLKSSLETPSAVWDDQRSLLIESDWAQWRNIGPPYFGVRSGQFLFLMEPEIMVFNSFVDRMEASPIKKLDRKLDEQAAAYRNYLEANHVASVGGRAAGAFTRVILARQFWKESVPTPESVKGLSLYIETHPKDMQLAGWLADLALQNRDWVRLDSLGKKFGKAEWTYVARRNLKQGSLPKRVGCLAYFDSRQPLETINPKECDDPLFRELVLVARAKSKSDFVIPETFEKMYRSQKIEEHLGALNYALELSWDVDPAIPAVPSLTDLYLNLPTNAHIRGALHSALEKGN